MSFKRNTYAEAQFTLSHEDDAAALLLGALANTGIPTLKCYRRLPSESTSTLRFNGYLAGLQEDAEEQSTLTATFRSPFAKLAGDGTARGEYLTSQQLYDGMDAGLMAFDLMFLSQSQPLASGDIQPTKSRTRTYEQGQNIGEAIVNLTNVLDGFDFAERFIEGAGTLALFDVFAAQGQDRPSVRFEYGPSTLANVTSVSRATLPPLNGVYVDGANGLVATATDFASITKYGPWVTRVSASNVVEQATLDDKAQALLRPNPVKTIQFTPEFGLDNCPKPWDDFWLGDTVRFLARRGALYENTTVRVNGIKVVVDENGIETAEVEDPTMPEEDAYIRATLDVEVGV